MSGDETLFETLWERRVPGGLGQAATSISLNRDQSRIRITVDDGWDAVTVTVSRADLQALLDAYPDGAE